ncbi:MAG: MerR family transcriptional regulator [Chloroflexi bacterium]|jgi:DNA-binding transcriptional MerR regulator|nr:MerR family transcriptional regulator [Anaerolineaceae bacterium]NLI43951.1 MerR family transcriptional regulator [Chloroflexota bacterium]HOE35520.1 MerR family transcriptional regulator [Anaerolineaceae bacterium]HOT26181.1 MerR family transcriptional regulator [Anaerolineaceae bacterium]HQK03617.1 MerR family transcriptional regulator [Anaerolineaceae bacterium]
MTSIGTYSDEPTYTIKVVQARTGIKPVTLRAWERRYNLLTPMRMPNGYRLYSERDIQLLLWVQRKLDTGLTISQVVEQFRGARSRGFWPETIQNIVPEAPKLKPPRPARDYAEMLFGALIAHNESRANAILDEVKKYFDLITVFQEVIAPSLELVGEAWYNGEIRIATEHMASSYIKGKLLNIMQNLPVVKEGALILVGCGPEENHELAALMFAVLLRQEGYFVEYLGPDLPTDDLLDYAAIVRPKLIVLSVNQENTAELMKGFAAELANVRGKPRLAYAGRYFDYNEQARRDLGGIYLGKTLAEALEKMKQLIMLV